MGRKMIGVGAPTSTGGRVLEGNVGINIDGLVSTSSVGHLASCPACVVGRGVIVAVGPRTIVLPAGPAALEDDYVACGCPPLFNTVKSAQSTVRGGAEHAGATSVPFAAAASLKSVKDIYFSYGSNYSRVGATSRFYVDLNIHIKTSGYSAGDIVTVNLSGNIERSLSAFVDADGVAVIANAFKDSRIEMEGDI